MTLTHTRVGHSFLTDGTAYEGDENCLLGEEETLGIAMHIPKQYPKKIIKNKMFKVAIKSKDLRKV